MMWIVTKVINKEAERFAQVGDLLWVSPSFKDGITSDRMNKHFGNEHGLYVRSISAFFEYEPASKLAKVLR